MSSTHENYCPLNFHNLVRERCSIRSFRKDRPLPEAVIHRILEAGRLAPSGKNLQPWTFIVVSSAEMLAKIYPCYSRDWVQSAPHLLIVKGKRSGAWQRKKDSYTSLETDLAIAMDHMILAAAYEGVGSCWIAAFDRDILYDALGLSDDEEIFSFTPLGYAAPDAVTVPKTRKPLDEVAVFL
ncbi:MAG: nitroreductase family protein [Chlorobium sp.]|jgi:nitroreductase|uniref:nitroreductase family protein n=1 Tax=Chlorobium sp. TaxID=1095 RepID=UPI001DC19082|nr:nitroreductase family protein [Chlorobium sp.]MBN1278639.1 nitroreductase family protein [Chlorobiaceae bacterium]MCF8216361.1 nitroreductase family protein [Chlorobium sp.]MCF8271264.1 nitroreductase family protein [Chlorobium sp.]MCF8287638.1 nitroreductase family protein [Chlorobium sp.]MCF8291177.1 nitroreductase family protein [Chlorobium sp.]